MLTNTQNQYWPGWETVRLIGRGSFGNVYEIQKDVLGDVQKAALKVISIPQSSGDIDEMYNDGYDDESITSTFQSHLKSIVAEYTLMRKMNGHSNIVSCDDIRYVQHEDGFGWDIFIKMELLTPLAKAIPADIPEETVIKVAKDLCAALELCKHYGIVHRDIKPQNIFLSPNGDYKLGDFGIAKTIEKTIGGTKIGTYKYMAPEVYNNQSYGTAADIYSLGLVLYWMLNEKRMPFLPLPPAKLGADMEAEARLRRFRGEPLPPPAHGSNQLQRIVLKACAPNLEDRYQSAAQMHRDLNAAFPGANDSARAEQKEPLDLYSAQAEQERIRRKSEDQESRRREQEERERLLREKEEKERIRREKEEWERRYREQEEQARRRREEEEQNLSRKQEEEERRQEQEERENHRWQRKMPAISLDKKSLSLLLGIPLALLLILGMAFFKSNIALSSSLTKIDGKVYYIQQNTRAIGWKTIAGYRYHFDSFAAMQTGWQKINNKWYYFRENGIMETGWKKLGGVRYYFDDDGVMRTGWLNIGGKKYYLDDEGSMQTDWLKINGKWYYFNQNGIMQTGWKKLGGVQYYFGEDGVMRTGWLNLGDKKYYLDDEGSMQTDWLKINGKWYYFNQNGIMQTGWKKLGGVQYYFLTGGSMAVGSYNIDGTVYLFDSEGALIDKR